MAKEYSLLRSDLETWKLFRECRIKYDKSYDEKMGEEILSCIPGFLKEVQHLIAQLKEHNDLKKSIKSLEQRNQLYKLKQDDEITKVALGKTFELCYECLKKSLRQHLQTNSKSAWKIFELATKHSAWKISQEQWEKYIKARNASTHDYSEQNLEESISIVDDFLKDAIIVYENITGESWT